MDVSLSKYNHRPFIHKQLEGLSEDNYRIEKWDY
ncbi:hypothetical protein HCH_02518 [Hahella chejuensis KCTC 2396]|uniref:Uncharacterized protein n=1 Tax=Hahella chejuensis (strain KCTC 2396) TaxID=349521 RepID=Q2SJ54_HAHCH|nr:hypothetical protein HCH_02518 [Hahella chejuensis KCTC 2396]